MSLSRREFLASVPALGAQAAQAPKKPNVVFILADDLGYGDLGCYGQREIATPNLDRMAAEGTRFTQAYAGSTVCAPSRCALMTGLHTGHARIRGNLRIPLEPGDVTIPKVLKSAGYRTGIIGKWGLGNAGTAGVPNLQGFDEWLGYLDQQHAHSYYPDHLWENGRDVILARNLGLHRQYSHDLFTERALSFLDRRQSNPFFLYLSYTIPHANNELGNDTGNGMEVPSDALYSNSVFFTSDNGPHREGGHNPDFFRSSGPLRGIKRDLYEGGIRVPMLARWPGKLQPGTVSEQVLAFWDILPTAAELAGLKPPRGIDGISMLPALTGKAQENHRYLYWEFHERGFSQAVRMGHWKGVKPAKRAIELYNLQRDPGEASDCANEHPEIVAAVEKIMAEARTESKDFPT